MLSLSSKLVVSALISHLACELLLNTLARVPISEILMDVTRVGILHTGVNFKMMSHKCCSQV